LAKTPQTRLKVERVLSDTFRIETWRSMSRIPLPSQSQSYSRTNSTQTSLSFPHNPVIERASSPLGPSPSRPHIQLSPSVSMSSNISGQHGSLSETRRKQSKRDEVCVLYVQKIFFAIRVSHNACESLDNTLSVYAL
jgi:hypothetical protein